MELNSNQLKVMRFIVKWTHEHNEPIPQHIVLFHFKNDFYHSTLVSTLGCLKRKGFIRKAINVKPVAFVRLRSVMTYN
jgi:hypothetical protein